MLSRSFRSALLILPGLILLFTSLPGCLRPGQKIPVVVTCTPASLTPGQTSQCKASAPGFGPQDVTWKASPSADGKISTAGLFTAAAPGTVTITATSKLFPTISGSTTIVIAAPNTITGVTVNCLPATIYQNQTSQCAATVTVTGTFSKNVVWSVTPSTAGTITTGGVFTPSGIGTPTITATSTMDPTRSGTFNVTVQTPPTITSISVSCSTLSVPVSQTDACAAVVAGTGAFNSSVNWSVNGIGSGNTTVGMISATGLYTAPSSLPTPFAVTITATSAEDPSKSASFPVVVAGTIGSTSQNVAAATGATITLSDGSGVVIPPGALPADETVVLTEISTLPQQPPNQIFVGVGTALTLSFSTPIQPSALRSTTRNANQTRPPAAASASTPTALSFSINESGSTVGSTGAMGLGSLTDTSGNVAFVAVPYSTAVLSTQPYANLSVDPSTLGAASSSISILSVSAFNTRTAALGIPPSTTPVPPKHWCLSSLDPASATWDATCPTQVPGERVLVLVHGMMSCINETFAPAHVLTTLDYLNNYDLIVGLDYDWTQSLATNAGAVEDLIDNFLAPNSPSRIDIVAHSEGVPVGLYGATESSHASSITNFAGLAGPILGTPVAGTSSLVTDYLTIQYDYFSSCWNSLSIAEEIDGYDQENKNPPFEADLAVKSPALMYMISQIQPKLGNTKIVLAGGTNPNYGGGLSINADTVQGNLFGAPLASGQYPTPNDGIIGLNSALAYDAGFKAYPLPTFLLSLNHLQITEDQVLSEVANQFNLDSPTLDCSQPSGCEGALGAPFTFTGSGFSSTAGNVEVFSQDSTGTVTEFMPSIQDANGDISWVSTPSCADPSGTFSIFTWDKGETLASNDLIQVITAPCAGPNPQPSILFLAPSAIQAGSPQQTLTINGTGFINSVSTVTFNGHSYTPSYISSSQLSITLSSTDLAQSGTYSVIVANPPPGGGPSVAATFTVFPDNQPWPTQGTVPVGAAPTALAINPQTNTIYVANTGAVKSITVIHGVDNTTQTIPLPFAPWTLAVNPNTNKIFVVGASNLDVIDGSTNSVTPIPLAASATTGGLYDVAVNSQTNTIYVVNYNEDLTVINGSDYSYTTKTKLGGPGFFYPFLVVNEATNQIYLPYIAPGGSYGSLTIIDGSTLATTGVPVGQNPSAVIEDPVTKAIYVANYWSSTITIINESNLSATTVAAGPYPLDIAANPTTGMVYVGNASGCATYCSGGYTILDTANNSSTVSIPEASFKAVAVNPNTNKIYFTNPGYAYGYAPAINTVFVLDGATNKTTSLTVGSQPWAIAINPITNIVYVTNNESNDVSVIQP